MFGEISLDLQNHSIEAYDISTGMVLETIRILSGEVDLFIAFNPHWLMSCRSALADALQVNIG